MTRLTIAIVAFNAREDLARTLESLTTSPPATSHEVIVVDNASSDGLASMVTAAFPNVRLLEAGQNLGFARANNLAIRSTASELVLLLNPDTVVSGEAIDRLVAVLDADPRIAIAGPRIVDAAGRAELSCGDTITPAREAMRKLIARLDLAGLGPAARYVDRRTRIARDVAWVTGACLLVRRADAEAVGLLDERYFLYMEDVDFCAAIAARRRRIRFEPAAEIVHSRGRSGLSASAAAGPARRAWHQSHLAYYRKHLPSWAPWLARYQRWRGIPNGE